MKAHAVLFDLDGTLLDTAPDLIFALNQLRKAVSLAPLDLSVIRPIVGFGAKAMLKAALEIEENHPEFLAHRDKFIQLYEKHLADSTTFFPEMDAVLTKLESLHIPWGIVTNKLSRHTTALLAALQLDHRPKCVISGDTLTKFKPDPLPILHACQLLQVEPTHCIYVGDAKTDVMASKAAGTVSLVALYGYIGEDENPLEWGADGYLKRAGELLEWI